MSIRIKGSAFQNMKDSNIIMLYKNNHPVDAALNMVGEFAWYSG